VYADPLAASREAFDRAQHLVIFKELLAQLRGEPTALLPFEEVRQKLRLSNPAYRGLQEVPLEGIIGSFARYADFTRAFLPRQAALRDRWATVHRLAGEQDLPPVELYQVGEAFFVSDGHHRISVARQSGTRTVRAHVYRYHTCSALGPGTTFEDLLIEEERLEFLRSTGLDQSRPQQAIRFTSLGHFPKLECQIASYQAALSLIDERPFSYPEAAAYWYDMYYTPIVQLIRQRELLRKFAHRTESDLFVWVTSHQEQLSEVYGYDVQMSAATDHVKAHHGGRWFRRAFLKLQERLSRRQHRH